MLAVESLSKFYGEKRALHQVGFEVAPGEVFGLVGPNGAGKTTAIRILVGLLQPDSGRVLFKNEEVTPGGAMCHRIGYFADDPFVYEKLTGREVLRLIGRLQAIDEGVIDARIGDYAERLNLASQLDYLTEGYSRGNRRKIGLITALLGEPELIAMDEPTESFDPVVTATLRDLVQALASEGRGLLISTHNLAFAESVCSRIGMLSQGELRFVGTIEEGRVHFGRPRAGLEELFMAAVHGHSLNRGPSE